MMPGSVELVQDSESVQVQKVPWWYVFTILSGIILGCSITSAITLIPQHNVIAMPTFWFEFTLLTSFTWAGSIAANCVIIFKFWHK